jgi:serine/threonine protein kinase
MHLILTDFGLATRLPLGAMGGAIQYQSPEVLLGGMAGAAADVFGVGLIWYEMLTGRHPFADVGLEARVKGDDPGYIRAHQESRKWPIRPARPSDTDQTPRVPPPSELNEQVRDYPQLESMLQRCLAYKQSERYANAALLLRDLDKFLKNEPLLPSCEPSQPTDNPSSVLPERTPEMAARDVAILLADGRRDQALAMAEELVRQQPRFVAGMLALARALVAVGQVDRARELCSSAQRLDHEDPEVFGTMADVYQAAARPAMAASCREQERRLRQQKTQRRKPRGAP